MKLSYNQIWDLQLAIVILAGFPDREGTSVTAHPYRDLFWRLFDGPMVEQFRRATGITKGFGVPKFYAVELDKITEEQFVNISRGLSQLGREKVEVGDIPATLADAMKKTRRRRGRDLIKWSDEDWLPTPSELAYYEKYRKLYERFVSANEPTSSREPGCD